MVKSKIIRRRQDYGIQFRPCSKMLDHGLMSQAPSAVTLLGLSVEGVHALDGVLGQPCVIQELRIVLS